MSGTPRPPLERPRSPRQRRILAGTVLVLAAAALGIAIWWLVPDRGPAGSGGEVAHPAPARTADFVGSRTCATCHIEQADAWRSSHHALAMQPANDSSVLGDFSGGSFTADGETRTFLVRDILTKSFGTNNPVTLVKATIDAMSKLRTHQQVEALRGVELESVK